MLTFQHERLFECVIEAQPLIAAHHEELEKDKPGFSFAVDWDQYRRAEEAGALHIVTARKDGVLIGYALAFITPHRHCEGAVHAQGDIIYLSPEHRMGRNGIRLETEARAYFKSKGATFITWSAKMGSTLEKLLPMVGYKAEEVVYGRPI